MQKLVSVAHLFQNIKYAHCDTKMTPGGDFLD